MSTHVYRHVCAHVCTHAYAYTHAYTYLVLVHLHKIFAHMSPHSCLRMPTHVPIVMFGFMLIAGGSCTPVAVYRRGFGAGAIAIEHAKMAASPPGLPFFFRGEGGGGVG